MLDETYKLNNGVSIPKIGLGTWMIDNDKVVDVVKSAIKLGYRHIDTAEAYENEEGVGKAIKESGVKREELFITTKIGAKYKTYDEAKNSILESLDKLGLDYIDLMIIHSPEPWQQFRGKNHYFKENVEVYRALEDMYKEGKLKAIGVSNFLEEDLENIINNCEIKPQVNQILCHIANTPFDLINYCKKNDILVEAYSPIAHGVIINDERIIDIANKYNVSIPRLCIRYTLQLGCVTLPKASSLKHMKDNSDVDFEISKEDMDYLKNIKGLDYGKDKIFPVFSSFNS